MINLLVDLVGFPVARFFVIFYCRVVFRFGFRSFFSFVGYWRVPCALTYTCFLWCTSDLEEEQVQQEPEDSQQECIVDEAEEEAEV